jgi:hypothetical protein
MGLSFRERKRIIEREFEGLKRRAERVVKERQRLKQQEM